MSAPTPALNASGPAPAAHNRAHMPRHTCTSAHLLNSKHPPFSIFSFPSPPHPRHPLLHPPALSLDPRERPAPPEALPERVGAAHLHLTRPIRDSPQRHAVPRSGFSAPPAISISIYRLIAQLSSSRSCSCRRNPSHATRHSHLARPNNPRRFRLARILAPRPRRCPVRTTRPTPDNGLAHCSQHQMC